MTIDYTKPEDAKPEDSSNEPPPVPPGLSGGKQGGPSEQETTWGLGLHLSTLLAYTGLGFVGASIIAPLVVWIMKKDKSEFLDAQGKEAVNFNLSMLVWGAALTVIVFATFGLGLIVAVPLGAVFFLAHIICSVLAGLEAKNGGLYRYPLTIRFLK